jgi:hypothetical protein
MKIAKKYLQKIIQEELQNTLKEFRWPWEDEEEEESSEEKEAFRQSMLAGTQHQKEKEFAPNVSDEDVERMFSNPEEFIEVFMKASVAYAVALGGTSAGGYGAWKQATDRIPAGMKVWEVKPYYAKWVEKQVFPSQKKAGYRGGKLGMKWEMEDLNRELRKNPKVWVLHKMAQPGGEQEAEQKARELGAPDNVLKAILAGDFGVVKPWVLGPN